MLDPELGTLAHRLVRALRPCSDHDRLDPAGDRAQVVVRVIAFHLVGVGVDRGLPRARLWYAPTDYKVLQRGAQTLSQ